MEANGGYEPCFYVCIIPLVLGKCWGSVFRLKSSGKAYCISSVIRHSFFFLPKQSQEARSILEVGPRSLGLFRKGQTCIIAKFPRTDLVICSRCGEGETLSYGDINTVRVSVYYQLLSAAEYHIHYWITDCELQCQAPLHVQYEFNPIALILAKTLWSMSAMGLSLWSFGHSECNKVKSCL